MRLPEKSRDASTAAHTRTHATSHTLYLHSARSSQGNPRCDTARRPSRGSNAGGQAGHCQSYQVGRSFHIWRRRRSPVVDGELVGPADESHVVGVENLPLLLPRGTGTTAVPIGAAAAVSLGCRKRRARVRTNGILRLPPSSTSRRRANE